MKPSIQTIQLGNTATEVSAICLGTKNFGCTIDEETAYSLLDLFVEYNGTFIDTANFFSYWIPPNIGGESETLIGRWLRRRSRRGRMFIATKVGFDYPGVERGLRSLQIERECEKSLKRLDTDHIDLYYANLDDRTTPLEETLKAFNRLIEAGKIRFIGASNFKAWRLEEANWISEINRLTKFCCIQQRYSYLQPCPDSSFGPQQVANSELMDYCTNRAITMLAYSPLLSGAYADKPLPPQYDSRDNQKRLGVLNVVASELNVTVNQIVLSWMMQSEQPVIPVIGVSSMTQLEEGMRAAKVHLSQYQMERLNNAVFVTEPLLS